MQEKTKKIVTMAMLCALAYAAMAVARIPVVLFLKYEPKDIVIAMGGFLYGPMAAMAMSVVVSLAEMVTVSDTGIWGCIMNIVSTCSFVCTAAFVYKKRRTLPGAAMGLILGLVVMCAAMMAWNYGITPLYMGYPREAVAAMLLPVFLPFNLVKGGLNVALTLLLYKPVVGGLRRAHLVEPSAGRPRSNGATVGIVLFALAVLITCVLVVLSMQGII
nr:ECF transporter S component [bacterium]